MKKVLIIGAIAVALTTVALASAVPSEGLAAPRIRVVVPTTTTVAPVASPTTTAPPVTTTTVPVVAPPAPQPVRPVVQAPATTTTTTVPAPTTTTTTVPDAVPGPQPVGASQTLQLPTCTIEWEVSNPNQAPYHLYPAYQDAEPACDQLQATFTAELGQQSPDDPPGWIITWVGTPVDATTTTVTGASFDG